MLRSGHDQQWEVRLGESSELGTPVASVHDATYGASQATYELSPTDWGRQPVADIDDEEAKRIVLAELMKQLGLAPETLGLDEQAAREQHESDQARDTYAYYGLTMYTAQVFEHEVVNLLVLARIVRAQENAERILSDPWERRFRDTLGELFKRLKPFLAHDQQLLNDVAEAVRIRNRLAHAYWREHAEDAVSVTGRAEMIAELIKIKDLFTDLDERLTRVAQPFRESLGITDDKIQEQFDAMKARVAERDSKI
jgi:hypothetical protein